MVPRPESVWRPVARRVSTLAARSDSEGGCCWFLSVVSVVNPAAGQACAAACRVIPYAPSQVWSGHRSSGSTAHPLAVSHCCTGSGKVPLRAVCAKSPARIGPSPHTVQATSNAGGPGSH